MWRVRVSYKVTRSDNSVCWTKPSTLAQTNTMDSGFPAFVNLLSQPGDAISRLADETVHGAIAHYAQAIPTQNVSTFIRALVSSPSLWSNQPWAHLLGTQAALRQALRLKVTSIKQIAPRGFIFGPDLASPLRAWVDAVCEGLGFTGASLTHLHASISILSGLSLALDDVQKVVQLPNSRHRINTELSATCAKVIHFHASMADGTWGREFNSPDLNERMRDVSLSIFRCPSHIYSRFAVLNCVSPFPDSYHRSSGASSRYRFKCKCSPQMLSTQRLIPSYLSFYCL